MSRSTIQRILQEGDLQPHRSLYWLNGGHGPDFRARMDQINALYRNAKQLWHDLGELVWCVDEKTGILIQQRLHPTRPPQPGQPRRVEHEYVRHGSTQMTTSFAVPTGQASYTLSEKHDQYDFIRHLEQAKKEFPEARKYRIVLDNNSPHSTLEVCLKVAMWRGQTVEGVDLSTQGLRRKFLSDQTQSVVFDFTPVHGSWLNQVELWLSVLSRRFLKKMDWESKEQFERDLKAWVAYQNENAHPYRWTYDGTPSVRDTPFERTRRQRRRGRSYVNGRPKPFQRLFDPPRPYRKQNVA